ncbi:energy-coupling factor transporter transmembrane component T family protein [Paenirhodobacter sp.]|uniref:energy-coupling factor transporter transmembrane component T family protein n=1 Tax=Paenirhodobacter sp. TaxID=1965326 RepID=UPI003B3F3CD2
MSPDAFRRANPLTRLALVAAVAAMLPLWPAGVLAAALAVVLAGGGLLGLGGVLCRRMVLLLAPLALALAVVHGVLIPRGPVAACGPLSCYPEGLAHAALVLVRLGLLLAVCLVFVMTTRPSDLARALDGAGVSPALSYLLTAPLTLIETVALEAGQIRDSLHLRGLSAKGWRARIRVLAAMMNPLVRGLITDAPLRAEALEMRGFRALRHRSLIDPVDDPRGEIWLRRGLLALAVAQVGALAL